MTKNKKNQKNKRNNVKKKSSRKAFLTAASVVLLILIAVGMLLLFKKCGSEKSGRTGKDTARVPETFAPPETESSGLTLGDGIRILSVGRYAGFYVEDGSDEIVSGVAMVAVKNEGEKKVRLLSFTLKDEKENEYAFQLTTLLPGEEMTVLEKNRKTYDMGSKIVSASADAFAEFSEDPSVHGETFRLLSGGNGITVENVTDKTVYGGKLYYKNVSQNVLVGGITYSMTIPTLAPGEKTTLSPKHYSDEGSRVMFITLSEGREQP